MMKKILVLCPTGREYRDLPAIAEHFDYQLVFDEFGGDYFDNPLATNDDGQMPHLDVLALIEDLITRYENAGLGGVTSGVGYPGMSVASIVAGRLGLPAPSVNCILLCEHKYYSRIAQHALVPQATPAFHLLDKRTVEQLNGLAKFPLFVKPVKANFSINANRVENMEELRLALDACSLPLRFIKPFNDLLAAYTNYERDASYLLAESLLEGVQVSLEGYVYRGQVHVIGIVDALMYPGTISFERFVYPSRLSEEVQGRMRRIAETFIKGINYDDALFNIEMMYDPTSDSISIIEVNPKIASQFTDLFEKVDGTNSYSPLLQIAAGDEPIFRRRQGDFALAASCVLRTFEDQRVLGVPSREQIDGLAKRFPDARVEVCASEGRLLSETMQDGKSYRYGLINIGADSEKDLTTKLDLCRSLLDFQFAPV
jgi:biotin carboxylase